MTVKELIQELSLYTPDLKVGKTTNTEAFTEIYVDERFLDVDGEFALSSEDAFEKVVIIS